MFCVLLLFVVSCRRPKNGSSNSEGLPIVNSFAFTKDMGIQLLEFEQTEKTPLIDVDGTSLFDLLIDVYTLKFAVIDRDGNKVAVIVCSLTGHDFKKIGTINGKPLTLYINYYKTCFFDLDGVFMAALLFERRNEVSMISELGFGMV
jgi:hypothetical protein